MTKTIEEIKEKRYGKKGTPKRDEAEKRIEEERQKLIKDACKCSANYICDYCNPL